MRDFGRPGSLDYMPKPAKPDPWEVEQERRREVLRAAAPLFAERGAFGVSRRQVAEAARMGRAVVERLYASDADLLAELLSDFAYRLAAAVCRAFDEAGPLGAVGRLEAAIRAWLDYVARSGAAHRAFLLCLPLASERHRGAIESKYWSVVETVGEALREAVPGLEAVSRGLLETIRFLLSDVWDWPHGLGQREPGQAARRITGMLVAAAMAERHGAWEGIGGVAGAREQERRPLESSVVRARFSEVLDYVAAGGEVTVKRHGRVVGKMMAVGLG